jgi:hypothetical protein
MLRRAIWTAGASTTGAILHPECRRRLRRVSVPTVREAKATPSTHDALGRRRAKASRSRPRRTRAQARSLGAPPRTRSHRLVVDEDLAEPSISAHTWTPSGVQFLCCNYKQVAEVGLCNTMPATSSSHSNKWMVVKKIMTIINY